MAHLFPIIATAVGTFAAANIGDLLVLFLFFADRRFRYWQVVTGQYLGVSAVIALCLMGAAAASYLPQLLIRALGAVPIVVGVHKLTVRSREQNPENVPYRTSGWAKILTVASISFADCGDNLAIFTPLYARSDRFEKSTTTLVFLVMIGVWCASARYLVCHGTHKQRIRKLGDTVAPWALIGLGLFIIFR